jgi:hypothetical protein
MLGPSITTKEKETNLLITVKKLDLLLSIMIVQ